MSDAPKFDLVQENMFENRYARLRDDHVELKIDGRSLQTTLQFPYDRIGPQVTYRRDRPQPNYSLYVLTRNAAIILFFCSLFGVFDGWKWFFAMFVSSGIFFAIHAYTYKSMVSIQTDLVDDLELMTERPNKEAVNNFIESVFDRRNTYVKNMYLEKSRDPATDRESWLRWMRLQKVLSEREYEAELAKLNGATNEVKH